MPGADQGPATAPKPWPAGVVGRAASLAAWIAACDLGLKIMARAGGCADAPALGTVVSQAWSAPTGECAGAPLWGDVLLRPAVRDGALLGVSSGSVGGVTGQLWALGLLALATVVTTVVIRWRWRDPGDALALAALWAGAGLLAVPRLMGGGTGFTELSVFGTGTGLGDLSLIWGLAWLAWRAIAEARA